MDPTSITRPLWLSCRAVGLPTYIALGQGRSRPDEPEAQWAFVLAHSCSGPGLHQILLIRLSIVFFWFGCIFSLLCENVLNCVAII